MEARLAKMCVVGLRYDSGNIQTDNMQFDFTIPKWLPGHGANILRNGGGKGVFFQCLFQTLDPLTSWKGDANKVSHFFFNGEERPIQYTFHIVQEWWISLHKRVILGIAVTPRLSSRETKKESASPIELDYFLYTSEPAMEDGLDIFEFPLWNETEKEALPFEEWKGMLSEDDRFIVYNKYQRDDYLAKIEEYGYVANTVNILKSINIGEGSLGDYFKGATDNMGLFFHQLIPTLSDKIEEIDSRNKGEFSIVSTSFLDTLKIAKELPDLMAMVDSIEQINDHILPLKDRFKEGEELKENFERWQNKGKELYQLLKALLDAKEEKVGRLNGEEEKRQIDLQAANWKLQNVDYIEIHQERDTLDGQYFELEHQQKKADLALKELNKELMNSQLNLELRRRKNKLDDIASLKNSIQSLLDSEDVKSATKGIQDITSHFKTRWDTIFVRWEKELNRNYRSKIAHTDVIKKLDDNIKDEREQETKYKLSIHDLDKSIKGFEEKLGEACKRYGSELPYTFSEFIEETRKELHAIETKLDVALDNEESLKNKQVDTKISIAKHEQSLDTLLKEIVENKRILVLAAETEKVIVREASHLLKTLLSQENDREGFHLIKNQLQQYLTQKRNDFQSQLRKMWTVQEDVYLIEEGEKVDAYIPNADLLKIKKLLEAQKIECMFGTEFLNQLSPAEGRRELEKNPALRYSIVVVESSFESLNFAFIQDEIIRNHVVLVDKTQSSKKEKKGTENPFLSKQDEMNFLLKDRSYFFSEDEYEFNQWRASIEKLLNDADVEMTLLDTALNKTDEVLNNINILMSGKLKLELEQKGLQLQEEKVAMVKVISDAIGHLVEIDKNIEETQASIQSLMLQLDSIKKKEEELVTLQKEQETYKDNKSSRIALLELTTQVKINIEELEKEREYLNIQDNNNQSSFSNWLKITNQNFVTLKGMLGDIHMPHPDTTQSFQDADLRANSYSHSLAKEDLNQLLAYRELDTNLSNKNVRIAELKAKKDVLTEKVAEFEQKLQTLSGDVWKTVIVPEVDEIHLISVVSQCEKTIKDSKTTLISINDDMRLNQKELEKVGERLNSKKEEIDKEFPQRAQYMELDDCKEAREKFRKERNRLKQESSAVKAEINQLTRSIADIQNTSRLLESLSLSVIAKIPSTLTDEEKVSVMTNPMEYYTIWTHENNKATNEYRLYQDNLGKRINQIKDKIESFTNIPVNYQRELVHFLSVIRDMSFEEAVTCLDNYLEWAQHNLQDELEQKEKADKAIDLYVERQSRKVLEIIHALQDLVRKMTIVNWKGERVRLVKFNKNYPFPNNLEDIRPLVKEFCLNEIDYYVKRGKDRINELTVQDVAKTVNISKLTLKVLGDFPKLLIHIPSIEGGLLRGEEKHLTYKEWETINHGSNSSPTKSGGQTLLAHLMVLAMIMRQRVDENSSLFLVSDNPFGTMSAKELIEATFSLLDLLNIQWIVVAPPIANVHITSKFPTINNLGLQVVDGRQVLTQKLVKNYRKYLENIRILENPNHQTDIS